MFALQYHEATKHHFNRFARSLGYLDWATQPDPFRRFAGAPTVALTHDSAGGAVAFGLLFASNRDPAPIDTRTVGEFLRCSLGLSAWKRYRDSHWALRVNPSSGNLHPTEGYVIREGRVCHYAPRDHLLEERCTLANSGWHDFTGGASGFLVALTSVHWREAWKYGERAFRYCQHDVGHAIGALRFAAALLGWKLTLLPRWSDHDIAALTGIDRDDDYTEVEREEPECVAVVTAGELSYWIAADPAPLVAAARQAPWRGTANRLSPNRIEWPIIDRVAEATRYPGVRHSPATPSAARASGDDARESAVARNVILRRRSAVAFDGETALARDAFFSMLASVQPTRPPWDAIGWAPQVHLALFVHRVEGLTPGIYAFLRSADAVTEWRAALRSEFLWERVTDATVPGDEAHLYLLLPTDVTWPANRVSCDQDIASDGFFSLGMIARFRSTLESRGEWFYRRLFWECGLLGQVLYLEAEAVGARATGIGCFYDDAVHDLLGISGHEWQSLYHFSMGMPVEDPRITTEPGYPWEAKA